MANRHTLGIVSAWALVASLLVALLSCTDGAAQNATSAERAAAEVLVEQGMALSDGSKAEEQCYLRAYEMDPTYARPLFDLGLVYSDRRLYEVAITYFEQFLDFEPGSLPGLYQIAGCYDNLGRDTEALEFYSRYLDAVAQGTKVSEDEKAYVDYAVQAVRRISGRNVSPGHQSADAPVVSRSQQIDAIMKVYNEATVADIVNFLSRPRIRAANFRLDTGPFYANSNITFNKNSSAVLPSSYDALDHIAEALMSTKIARYKVMIAGHASTEGTDEYNDALSRARAESIKKYLVREYNINPDRLDIEAFGERDLLISPELSESDRKQNRRVEFENTGVEVQVVDHGGDVPQ